MNKGFQFKMATWTQASASLPPNPHLENTHIHTQWQQKGLTQNQLMQVQRTAESCISGLRSVINFWKMEELTN